jgi:hypothetical protein
VERGGRVRSFRFPFPSSSTSPDPIFHRLASDMLCERTGSHDIDSSSSFSTSHSRPSSLGFSSSYRRRTTAELVSRYATDGETSETVHRSPNNGADEREEDGSDSSMMEKPEKVMGRLLKSKVVSGKDGNGKRRKQAEEEQEMAVEAKEESDDELLDALDELIGSSRTIA